MESTAKMTSAHSSFLQSINSFYYNNATIFQDFLQERLIPVKVSGVNSNTFP